VTGLPSDRRKEQEIKMALQYLGSQSNL
jgi:hypothetical protein